MTTGEMHGDEGRYLTKKAFAQAQGWAPSYVTKLKEQGRLVLDGAGKLVDVPATLARLRETADPTKQGVRDHHAEQRAEREVLRHVRHDAPVEPPAGAGAGQGDDEQPSDNENYWKAKARREALLADLAAIELRKAEGELVELEAVRRGLAEASRMLRDMILAVPDRVAPQAAASGDAAAVQRLMREELRKALDQFVRLATDQLGQVGEG